MAKSVLLALILGTVLAAGTVCAVPLPTQGDVVHFDLNPGTTLDTLLRWPGIPAYPAPVVGGKPPTYAGAFEGGEFVNFTDTLQSNALHKWKIRIQNPTTVRRTFKLLIVDENPNPLSRNACVTLDPGWSILITLHVSEGDSEMGKFTWLAGSFLKYQIKVDSSVTENKFVTPDPYPFPCDENTDGCTAVAFVDPMGNIVQPNQTTGSLYRPDCFMGCPDVFVYKSNRWLRLPYFCKLRCVENWIVAQCVDQIIPIAFVPVTPPG